MSNIDRNNAGLIDWCRVVQCGTANIFKSPNGIMCEYGIKIPFCSSHCGFYLDGSVFWTKIRFPFMTKILSVGILSWTGPWPESWQTLVILCFWRNEKMICVENWWSVGLFLQDSFCALYGLCQYSAIAFLKWLKGSNMIWKVYVCSASAVGQEVD